MYYNQNLKSLDLGILSEGDFVMVKAANKSREEYEFEVVKAEQDKQNFKKK